MSLLPHLRQREYYELENVYAEAGPPTIKRRPDVGPDGPPNNNYKPEAPDKPPHLKHYANRKQVCLLFLIATGRIF